MTDYRDQRLRRRSDEGTGSGPWAWGRLLVAVGARSVLAAVVALALWGALPALIGWQPTTVVTGSMMPRIAVGDVAVAAPAAPEAVVPGRIALFDDPDHAGRLRLHRVVDVDEQGLLVTRGDANPADDSSHVDPATVHGVGVLRVPAVGLPVVWFHEGRLGLLALVGAAVAALLALSALDRDLVGDDEDDDEDEDEGPRRAVEAPTAGRGLTDLPVLVRAAVGTAVLAVVVGLLVTAAAPAHAAYSAAAGTTGGFTSAGYYSCSSAPVADDPYLYWKLDETSGTTLADSSGNNRRATIQTSGFSSVAAGCGTGRALSLGSSSYASQSGGAVRGFQTFTVETWFRTTTWTGGRMVGFGSTETGTSGDFDRHIYMANNGTLVFGVYPNRVETIRSPRSYNDGAWHHVAATLSSAGMRLFVDGSLVASSSSATTAEVYDGRWRIGRDNLAGWGPSTPMTYGFTGSLDDVAVYDHALSPAQVAGHSASRS
ncbi:LamG domain-containing protein [Auraticoccus monumenti]|uniref:Concanavalin A-like lectin/glucanases superfamily protein n=1 Tax=Auraticoccus monumenti TaxID=675864 RepID=A0A1G6WDF2_9ACTN|nr:LamG domain-containing protein [Auraticoccus monumenti]SDD63872.1 Concanavalin A-like lectin/glucanases superfamily protein [Auraticoccus monumenti]